MAVEAEFGEAGAAAAEFDQLAAGEQRDFRSDRPCFRHGDGSGGDAFGIRRGGGCVEHSASAIQQRLGGVHANRQAADLVDGQRVVAGFLHSGIDPRPRAFADEHQRVLVGGAGDAGVYGGVEDLREGADSGRALEGGLERHHILGLHCHAIEQHRAAAGGALAEAGPVVDNGQPGAVVRHEGQLLHAIVVDHQGRNALRIERAGAIELAPVDAQAAAVALQAGGALVGGARADFREGVAEAFTGQHLGEQAAFLRLAAVHPQHFEGVEVVLRNLSEGGVGGGDNRYHPGQGDAGNTGTAILARHADAPQAGAAEALQFVPRQAPFAVALDGAGAELGGQGMGDVERLVVAGDDVDGVFYGLGKAHGRAPQIQE
ncbi:hypothetical protein D3C78_996420 [compost metagenome]